MRRFAAVLLCLAAPALVHAQALSGTLKKIHDSKTVAIAYRTDALPFSYAGADKQPAGYTVELCKRVAASLEQQLKVQLKIKWVAATTQNRLELVRKGQAQMECGSTTATFSRMEIVDFSSPVFVDTTGLLVRKASGARSLSGLAGKKIAVISGTSNQQALEASLKKELVSATVTPVKDREEGIAALEAGSVDAFAGDKILLLGLALKVKDPSQFELLADDLGFEPYAIALPRNDSSFRLAVNRALAQVFQSDAIAEIFHGAFGPDAKPSPALLVMFGLGSFPQ
ncbi:MAG: amino acid ABC transporter substrate-binding protein [Burkholderiales bacterium]|nr:amino acid ABC transporter substrate-binding protein [Burkholderiales bacterium]